MMPVAAIHPKGLLLTSVRMLALLTLCTATIRADVELTRLTKADSNLYVLSNDWLRVVIDPSDGGCLSALEVRGEGPGLLPSRGGCKLIQDAVDQSVCRYRVDYLWRSRSVATLPLSWQREDGLKLQKTFSLLDSELTVRVAYRIENGSQSAAALTSRSVMTLTQTEPTEIRAMTADDLQETTVERLWSVGPMVLSEPRWLCLAGLQSQQGLLMAAGAGIWEGMEVLFSAADSSLRVQGGSVSAPAGKILEGNVSVIPFHGVGPIVGLGAGILCGMDVETAGRTARIRSNLLPLANLSFQSLALSFKDRAGEELERLSTGPLKLSCGKPERFTFYWVAPDKAQYTCELVVPEKPAQRPVVSFRLQPGAGPVAWLDTQERSITFGEVEGWERIEPKPVEWRKEPLLFRDCDGTRIAELRCDVGVGEYETTVFEVTSGKAEEEYSYEQINYSITDCTARLQGKKIPHGNLSLVPVGGPTEEGKPEVPAKGPVRFALRVSSYGVTPGEYRGEVRVQLAGRQSSLPVFVKVWPVLRPQPGLVRLHIYGLPLSQGSSRDALPLWQELRRNQNVALALAPGQLWHTDWVRFLDSGLPLHSSAARGAGSLDATSLPLLDFSAMDPLIDDLVLMGMQDFVLLTDLTREQVGPRLLDRNDVPIPWETAARWFWKEFTAYVKGKGFRNLYVVSPKALGTRQMGWDWFKCASLLADCGWSVCGPYNTSALEGVPAPALGRLSKLLLFDESAAESIPQIVASIGTASGQQTETGIWLAGLDLSFSASQARQRIWGAWRMGVSLLSLGSLEWSERSSTTEGFTAAEALNSMAWDGVRDVLDEINYLAVLDWYLKQMESEGSEPPEASELAGRVRDRLNALCSKRAARAEGAPGPRATQPSGRMLPPLDKKRVLEMLGRIRPHVARLPRRLYWNETLLVDGEISRVEIIVEQDQPAQMAQAQVLRGIVKMNTGVSVPLVMAEQYPSAERKPIAIVLAGDVLNPVLSAVLSGREDRAAELSLRLRRSKHLIVQLGAESGARERYLFLLGTDEEHLGRAVMNFKMKLRQEGGWLLPSGE